MKVGTKSLLFGYHQVLLHPLMVASAWWKLFGFPYDPRLWAAFFVHDIGYFGKPNMDGPEGTAHPFVGAHIMHFLFDRLYIDSFSGYTCETDEWYKFTLYHSRSLAKVYFASVSKLCYADKLAFLYYPQWLLKLLYWLSGEGAEYMDEDREQNWDVWYAKVSQKNRDHVKEITTNEQVCN